MFYYKLAINQALLKNQVLLFFDKFILRQEPYKKKKVYRLRDNSLLILHNSDNEEKVYVEFHCKLSPIKKEKAIRFLGLSWFEKFCLENNLEVKILEYNFAITPSKGTLLSYLFHSKVFGKARHMASHPKDKQTLNRFIKELRDNL